MKDDLAKSRDTEFFFLVMYLCVYLFIYIGSCGYRKKERNVKKIYIFLFLPPLSLSPLLPSPSSLEWPPL